MYKKLVATLILVLSSISFLFISDNVQADVKYQRNDITFTNSECKRVNKFIGVQNNRFVLKRTSSLLMKPVLRQKVQQQLNTANKQIALSGAQINKVTKKATYYNDDIVLERSEYQRHFDSIGETKIVYSWSHLIIYLNSQYTRADISFGIGKNYASRADIRNVTTNLGSKYHKGIWIQKNYSQDILNYGWQ